MKQNFSVKIWPKELALEEIELEMVPFWVQIPPRGTCLVSEANVRRLSKEIGEFVELKDSAKARRFLRVRVIVNTLNLLTTGCWLPREDNKDT